MFGTDFEYIFTGKGPHLHLLVLQNRKLKKRNTIAIYFEKNNEKTDRKSKISEFLKSRLQQRTFSFDKVKFKYTVM